ncbi:12376_t:CDS:2 [Funneliformis caledonium]|uniref:12376_t:CDS:1 n=1 Tax=Funneliformis caledonium TaxID=1117310 RepID=A0A9N9B6Z4_9GLOM|nr:12376_t:CDS:2 [Funneliformis caledonium]
MEGHPRETSANDNEVASITRSTTQSSEHSISLPNTLVTNSGSSFHNMDNDNSNNSNEQTSPGSRGQSRAVLSSVFSSGPTSSFATTSVRATAAGSRRVRRNWWGYIVDSFRSISRTSKMLLILNLIMVLIQVVVTIVVLVISRNLTCDRPLEVFLMLYIVRVIVACPVNVYLYLNPRDNRRNGQNQNENENQRRDGWVDRLKSFLDLFATLWFIFGNYLLFTTSSCHLTSPPVFYLSLTWVILGYIIITIPILLCLAVIFCLPCVLVAMRVLNVSEAVGISGARDDVIQKIPLVKYKASGERHEGQQSPDTVITIPPPQIPPMTPQPSSTRKKPRFKFLFGRNSKGTLTNSPPTVSQYLTIPNSDDAVCSICLESYEDGEELRHLWCSHHFHKDCVDEWLRLNKKCPMCSSRVDHTSNPSEVEASISSHI